MTPASSIAPVLHGALTDHFGFRGSFALGGITAAAALWLVMKLPAKTDGEQAGSTR